MLKAQEETLVRQVSLLEDTEVSRISLVEHPANQRPFLLLKSDEDEKPLGYFEQLLKEEQEAWSHVEKGWVTMRGRRVFIDRSGGMHTGAKAKAAYAASSKERKKSGTGSSIAELRGAKKLLAAADKRGLASAGNKKALARKRAVLSHHRSMFEAADDAMGDRSP